MKFYKGRIMEIENLDIKKNFYTNLNERQKRHFLAIEAKQLGYGGITKVSKCFCVNRETISIGISELESADSLPFGRVRKEGGGRKKNFQLNQNSQKFLPK